MKGFVVYLSIAFIYFLPLNYTFAQPVEPVPQDNLNSLERRLNYIESSVYSNNKTDTLVNVLGVLGTLILGIGAYLIYQGNRAKELAQKDFERIRFLKKMVEENSKIVTEITGVMLDNSLRAVSFLRSSQDKAQQSTQATQELKNQIKQYLEDTIKITDNIKTLQQTISAKSRISDSRESDAQNSASSERGARITGTQATISDILKRLEGERNKWSHYTNEVKHN